MSVGSNIKQLRQNKGLTQKELGDLCGMADSAIRRYENGPSVPKLSTLNKIANALCVPITALIDQNNIITLDKENPRALVVNMKICSSARQIQNIVEIVGFLDKLNYKGQGIAKEQIEMLTKIPEYQIKEDAKKYVSILDTSIESK